LFHLPPLLSCFSLLLCRCISECPLTLLPLAKSPGRCYQPPALGQVPSGSCWGSTQFFFAVHVSVAFCLADPDPRIANVLLDTLDFNKYFLNDIIIHGEGNSWEDFLLGCLWTKGEQIHTHTHTHTHTHVHIYMLICVSDSILYILNV
jgi:hypothetical protein